MLERLILLSCNLLWLIASLPGWVSFLVALRQPRRAQERILRRLLKRNRETPFGRDHCFARIRSPAEFARQVPLAEYGDFAPPIAALQNGAPFSLAAGKVLLLEPTSGSSSMPKLIPCTDALLHEFKAAIDPWIVWLFLTHPRLLFGRHYWTISPATPLHNVGTQAVPVGFAQDAEYLGPVGRLLARYLQVAPPELREVHDSEAFTHLSLLFMLAERDLRLISVWHPSFLTLLLDAIPRHLPIILNELRTGNLEDSKIPSTIRERIQARFRANPSRAAELDRINLSTQFGNLRHVWPRLELISCWTDGRPEPWLGRINTFFPGIAIQGKGLLATEGVVTLPTGCGEFRPCAVRSHYLEFRNPATNTIHPLWELVQGTEYTVVLTTGGGLWRYQLHDTVRVTTFCHATPCLQFLGREGKVSDLVGEKLDERHVSTALATATAITGWRPDFAMLVPDVSDNINDNVLSPVSCGYLLVLDGVGDDFGRQELLSRFTAAVERELCGNYHYAHALNVGQLRPLRPVHIVGAAARYFRICQEAGMRLGTVKLPALDTMTSTPRKWAGAGGGS